MGQIPAFHRTYLFVFLVQFVLGFGELRLSYRHNRNDTLVAIVALDICEFFSSS